MKVVEYESKEFRSAVMRVDVHEYVDSAGVGWLVANDFSVMARMPDWRMGWD